MFWENVTTLIVYYFCFIANACIHSSYNAFGLVNWHVATIYKSANALNYCSYIDLVLWDTFFFFQVLNNNYSATSIIATVFSFLFLVIGLCFFFPFKYLCKLLYILLYLRRKIYNIFTIIDVRECVKAL